MGYCGKNHQGTKYRLYLVLEHEVVNIHGAKTVPKNQHKRGDMQMTENEKKLLQAKHRLEEAQARDRVKKRKERTRRLIQKGAILEKTMPETNGMTLEELETYLYGLTKR